MAVRHVKDRPAFLALVAASALFGITFVVVKDAIASLPPFNFVGWRFLLGAAVLLIVARPRGRTMWRDGTIGGLLLVAGFGFQTEGLLTTGAANSGLITGLYVVLTPLVAVGWNRLSGPASISGRVLLGTAVAFGGFFLLTDGFQPVVGDMLTVLAAVAFAVHIVFLSRLAHRHRLVAFTALQLAVTSAGAFVIAAVKEGIQLPGTDVVTALVITGLGASAGGFLLQIWAQSRVGAETTAIVLALEPAFAAGTAAIVTGTNLSGRGWVGAGLILMAIFLVLSATERPEVESEATSPH
ncbi:MAG: DMT family transporter [Acidimicrobiia bacterium]|nr:DMT family transporter [Acidimicrobiia bacterium]NNF09797.1 DMT family transporter [Acidimicrobiia bacterium]NNL68934.1 DMT family transporter [Acidimicrobiia bacterium]